MRSTTLDFSHNLDALGRCVARRQEQIARAATLPDVTVTITADTSEFDLGFDPVVPSELHWGNLEFRDPEIVYPATYNAWQAAEEIATAAGYKLIIKSPPTGDEVRLEYSEQATADSARGSFFARRPDEKGRPRRKRDNPPPPMSDLLGEIPK